MIIGIACQWSGVAMITAWMSLWSRMARKRSEEHTSELQSRSDLVCRLLLEKKKQTRTLPITSEEHTSDLQSRPHLRCRVLHENQRESVCSPDTHVRRTSRVLLRKRMECAD